MQGNPKMIMELCARLSKEEFLGTDVVSEVCDNYIGRETREFDMSVILFVLLGGVMALKYIGNETNDPDLRMIGGLMVIVMLFARSFFAGGVVRILAPSVVKNYCDVEVLR